MVRMTQDMVVQMVAQHPRSGSSKIVRLLGGSEQGITLHNVHAHLQRATEAGRLVRLGSRGRYVYHTPESDSAPVDADDPVPVPVSLDDARRQRDAVLARIEHDRKLVVALDAFISAWMAA